MIDTVIADARYLANYIIQYYEKKFGGQISPIKLQKSLYFCFAYWGGFVRKSKMYKNEINELKFSEFLFPNKIEAWVYGPVVPEVYHELNLDNYKSDNIFCDAFVEDNINGILDDVLKCNDFKLVDISHQDKCWQKHFKPKALFHNDEIPGEEIIAEYAKIN